MEGGDESAAAAALGLSPQLFVNEVLNMVDDVRREAFEYCLQEGVPEAVGGAAAAQKAEELERNDEQKEISYQYDTQVIEIKSLKALVWYPENLSFSSKVLRSESLRHVLLPLGKLLV